ncbi:cytochrome P450 [Sphingobium sufflavum]|uniref:cytochrome P450 n=1 Tax=Sphingobium sufflavum TaxID=1129547 RepID=UPI001F1AFBDE|nr:cytochrome P450 [Sphingobium sufflavum]MCE7796376.1 cytochrome P450 [Sphingobium sufflavum]
MTDYLERVDAAPDAEKWALVQGFMRDAPQPFFAEMRERRPVLPLPEVTLAFRFADCAMILRRHEDFGVDLYKPKQGDYFMAQDDTADHWRDKSIMRAILDFERIPEIRTFVAERAADILDGAGGEIDLPAKLTRAVPVAVVQRFFGLNQRDPDALVEWSYWNQQDAFHNQPFQHRPDADEVVRQRNRANIRLALYIGRLVLQRSIATKLGAKGDDPISRLLRISFSKGVKFPLKKVLSNAGGLLIGAVETTSHCANNVLAELFARPDALAEAVALGAGAAPERFDAIALEALRFRPAFPYYFRTCHRTTQIAGGTAFARDVQPGTTVLAITHSAMLDPANFPDPERFDPTRSQADNFTFGQGLHECLGVHVARPMLGEIVRQLLLRPGLRPLSPVRLRHGVPEEYRVGWG